MRKQGGHYRGVHHVHRAEVKPTHADRVIIRREDQTSTSSRSEGGRRVYFEFPSYTIDMHLTEIPPGGSSAMHRHYNEALIYILRGQGYSEIQDQRVKWKEGDVLYIPPWNWHRHYADLQTGAAYLAATNQPLLQNIGELHRTDERGDKTWAEVRNE